MSIIGPSTEVMVVPKPSNPSEVPCRYLEGRSPKLYGYYNFSSTTDLGYIQKVKLNSDILVTATRAFDTSQFTSYDVYETVTDHDWDIYLEVKQANIDDNIIGWTSLSALPNMLSIIPNQVKDWEVFQSGEYTARYFEFRLLMVMYKPGVEIEIKKCIINIDIPTRTEEGTGETNQFEILNEEVTITFQNPFLYTPIIFITIVNQQTNDHIYISERTNKYFKMSIWNEGWRVQRVFNWLAQGAGLIVNEE